MKKIRFLHLSGLFIVIISFLVVLFTPACKKDDPPAPDLPPEMSFIMDFADFENPDTTQLRDISTYKNWWRAASQVTIWSTFLKFGLAVPVASFLEAFNHEAIYDTETDTWIWAYNFVVGGDIYLANLKAIEIAEGILWEMYISKDNAYNDFLWYSGIVSLDRTAGFWELYKEPTDPVAMLKITWDRLPTNNAGNIEYLNVLQGSDQYGSYIEYGFNTATPYNAYYTIFNKVNNNQVDIEWDRVGKSGQITDPEFFDDAYWHCWNELHQDSLCN